MSSSSELGLLEFYNDQGDLIPLTDSEVIKEALDNKEEILKEQLDQLEKEMAKKSNEEEENEGREQIIKQAINDVKNELDRLQKLKIQ